MKVSRRACRWFLNAAVLSSLILPASHAAEPAQGDACGHEEWGYHEPIGPDHWQDLSPCNAQCGDGGEQSPIDIVHPGKAKLPPLRFSYGIARGLKAVNNGHTIQVDLPGGTMKLRIGGVEYTLLQFHFHTPSEHTVRGKEAPIELHLVHRGPGGRLAVVGIFIEAGKANPELSKIWGDLPKKCGEEGAPATLDLAGLLPKGRASYRYAGSLTTPACGQGVQWNVLASPITLTRAQIQDFEGIFSGEKFPEGNRRPVQPLDGRVVLTDGERP